MAKLTFSLMQQLAQTGTPLYFKREDFKLNEFSTFSSEEVTIKQANDFKPDFLKNLLDPNWIRMNRKLGALETWSYRFANNGFVEVFGLSVSPNRKLKTEWTITIKWGN